MAVVNTEPKFSKRRKLGKNKKKAWRVSNVDDLEDFLADERRQIRTGGLVSEKTNETLFVLDTGKNKVSTPDVKGKKSTRNKPLKCFALLQPNPHTKPVRIPDENGFQKGKRSQRILERLQSRSQSAVRLAAQKQREQANEKRELKRAQKRKLPEVDSDIWTEEDESPLKVKRPKGLSKKPSALQATVIPHPGASFNPSYEDHQDLLQKALVTEVVKEKKEKKLHNALDAMFPSKEEAKLNQALYLKEMAAGLYEDSEDEEEEDEESDEDEDKSFSVGAPVRREDKKTKKQKRIKLTEIDQTRQRLQEKELKKRQNMVLRIPTLKTEINKQQKKTQERIAQRKKKKEMQKFQTKRLNSIKYEEPDLDLKLSEELVPSLREVKPEGHIINDAYKSLQRRNIIEPRIRQKNKKKYKKKVFEKKSHKAVTL